MMGGGIIAQEIPSTIVINVEREFPSGLWDEGQENELISSFCPEVFAIFSGHEIILPPLSLPGGLSITPEAGEPGLVTRLLQWVVMQLRKLYREGLGARIIALIRKLKNKLTLVKQTP